MCGRFSTTASVSQIIRRFDLKESDIELRPNYNAAPSQKLPVIFDASPQELSIAIWGLIPNWSKEMNSGYKMINSKSETLLEKPYFKRLLGRNRCLVIADGFYEWKKNPAGKQPYRIILKSEEIFAFAGLWDTWNSADGPAIKSFSIITTSPNSLVKPIHDRMPVILAKKDEKKWLDTAVKPDELAPLLQPFAASQMKSYPVSTAVNSTATNTPDVLKALA